MEGRMAFVAVAEIIHRVFRPLIGLGQQHAALEMLVDMSPKLLEERMCFGKILATGPLALEQIRHSVQPHSVDAHLEPVVHHLEHRSPDLGIIEIQVGLMMVEAMPIIGIRDRIPSPIRGFEILENDPGFFVFIGRVAPDVEIAPAASRLGGSRAAEPGMLVGGVIEHQFGDNPQPAFVRLAQERAKIVERAVFRMDAVIIGDIVAVVA